jgi:hypothetical protein
MSLNDGMTFRLTRDTALADAAAQGAGTTKGTLGLIDGRQTLCGTEFAIDPRIDCR